MADNPLTCADMISLVRSLSGEHDPSKVFDGYPNTRDFYPPGISILPLINDALDDLSRTGFLKCYFKYPLKEGVGEYAFSHTILSVHDWDMYDSVAEEYVPGIEKTTMQILDDENDRAWRGIGNGTPEFWYQIGARGFGVTPKPSATRFILRFLADASFAKMEESGHFPTVLYDATGKVARGTDGLPETILPVSFHRTPCLRAAADICSLLDRPRRASELLARYKSDLEELSHISEERVDGYAHRITINDPNRDRTARPGR